MNTNCKIKLAFSLIWIITSVLLCDNPTSAQDHKNMNTSKILEIPHHFLNKPIHLINKISGYPNKLYHYGSSGMTLDYSSVLKFELVNDEFLKITQLQYQNKVDKNDIIKSSVEKNHFNPTICLIPVLSVNEEIISIDPSYFKKDIQLFSPVRKSTIKKYTLKPNDAAPTFIKQFRQKDNYIQISRIINYIGEKSPEKHYSKNVSIEQLLTFRLLPETPMKRRKWDPRVGNFYLTGKKYSSDNCLITEENYLEVWKLIPEDTEAYFRGELSHPTHPIVFYFDENVPHKWKSYIKEGVLSWLPVFEQIGFKDAIEVLDKPKDAQWDDADPNYNMIRWVSSEIKDAQGNLISDPRSGEILNGTLTWYQNYFESVNNEYFVNTAGVNPVARQPMLPDSVFGELMRETMAHEMGHTLGLAHNMIASSAYPTDSLRSKNFVEKHLFCSSIMDYASFNYVVQPEDMPVPLTRKIGSYDYWAIEHAYKYVQPDSNSDMTVAFSNEEINEKLKVAHLNYREQDWPELIDPTNSAGDLGDNPFLTTEYAIKNLQSIVPHMVEWSVPENGDPKILLGRHQTMVRHLDNIFKRLAYMVGGQESRYVHSEFIVRSTNSENSVEAVDFLAQHLFKNMQWFNNTEVAQFSNQDLYMNDLTKLQSYAVERILYKNRISRQVQADLKDQTNKSAQILRILSDAILKNSTPQDVPLEVQRKYVKIIRNLLNETKDNLILQHLLKTELDYMKDAVKNRSQSEKNPLLAGFYTELL